MGISKKGGSDVIAGELGGGWVGSFARAGRRAWATLAPGSRTDRDRALQLIETLALGPKKQIHLLSCEGRHFLVGTGAEGVATIVPVEALSERSVPGELPASPGAGWR